MRAGASLSHDDTPGGGVGLHWERRDPPTIDYPPSASEKKIKKGVTPPAASSSLYHQGGTGLPEY
jgi:hypothetical protein